MPDSAGKVVARAVVTEEKVSHPEGVAPTANASAILAAEAHPFRGE
jgi:hypothetical protein